MRKLLEVLQALVDQGNSVVVIEHNLDVIKTADYILAAARGGVGKGGEIVAAGTPGVKSSGERSRSSPDKYLAPLLR